MHGNVVKVREGVSVGASAVDTQVSFPFQPVNPGYANISIELDAVVRATGLTFSLKDSYDENDSFFAVGSESAVSVAAAKTATGGAAEVTDVTWPTHAAAANGDYLHATAHDGSLFAVYLNKRIAEVQTLTYPDKATAANGDYAVAETAAGVQYAVALTKPVAEVQTLTFPTVAGSTGGDYIVIADSSGNTWAAALNKSGADPAPTGAIYAAIPAGRKVNVNISGGTDEASVAALVELALDALTGFTALIVTDDSAADGTMLLTSVVKTPVVNPVPHNADDSGPGTISGVQTTGGVAAQTPTGALWVAATHKGLADISADTTAAQVAASAETAWNLLTGFTTAITSNDTAANGTMTFTQVLSGPTVNPVPKDFNDGTAGTITGVQSTAGVTTNTAPSGALYLAADEQIVVNIEPSGTAAATAAAARAAVVANAAWAAAFTTSAVTTATFTVTQASSGAVADPAPLREDDGAAGSVVVSVTTAGSDGGIVLATNAITASTHGFLTGDRVVVTGADLPAGLEAGVYWVIKVDTNTLKLAESQALAFAGTAVDITDYGSGTLNLFQSVLQIRMLIDDATDQAQLPLQDRVIVVANTGSGDSCTVSAVYTSHLK